MENKKRKIKIVAKRKLDPIPPERLYEEATKRGMTIKELVDYMAQRNRDHSKARNRSAFYVKEPGPLDKEKYPPLRGRTGKMKGREK